MLPSLHNSGTMLKQGTEANWSLSGRLRSGKVGKRSGEQLFSDSEDDLARFVGFAGKHFVRQPRRCKG